MLKYYYSKVKISSSLERSNLMRTTIPRPSDLNSIIQNSHIRCIQMGVDKDMLQPARILTGQSLQQKLVQNKLLLSIAEPFMNLLYGFLKGTGFIVDLTDQEGIIISIIGDDNVMRRADDMGMKLGTDMSEKSCGTNSIGTALHEKHAVQMAGAQHFIKIYQVWTCSSAPITDDKGKIIGCLNITGLYNQVHPHTLGFIHATAESIESEFRNIQSREALQHANKLNSTVMNAIDLPILTIDRNGIILSANKKATETFNYTIPNLIEKPADSILGNWHEIFEILSEHGIYKDEEYVMPHSDIKKKYNINAYPVKDSNDKVTAMVAVFKDIQNIYQLVNKYSGKNAYYSFNNIIGKSAEIREIIDYARSVSNITSTIIIQGESGTGKEIFAQSIHNESTRKHEPFIAINCGSIPKNLIESELFGYEEGSFTNARKGGMPGKFELANKGTLFLDEIGEMPLDMQTNLLRVIQEKSIIRIGGYRSMPIDVRVIVATNKNLYEEVMKGNFREDLYYRLNVIPISIPPLRERKDDIRPLIDHFLKIKSQKLCMGFKPLMDSDYAILEEYNWPGNVRELENRMENYVVTGKLPMDLLKRHARELDFDKKNSCYTYNMHSLDEWEKKAIQECIMQCKGNISKSASVLKIDRSTLYKKIKSHSIII